LPDREVADHRLWSCVDVPYCSCDSRVSNGNRSSVDFAIRFAHLGELVDDFAHAWVSCESESAYRR